MTNQIVSTRELVISVTGMSCGSCVRHISKALSAIPGVASIGVSLPTRTVSVAYDPAAAEPEDIVGAIRMSGYPAALPDDEY